MIYKRIFSFLKMYFVSEHSGFNESNVTGTLIGVYKGYLYSANSFHQKLDIYRKKIIDTGDWELVWNFEITNYNVCGCKTGVAVVYGIVADELYVGTYGRVSNFYQTILYENEGTKC